MSVPHPSRFIVNRLDAQHYAVHDTTTGLDAATAADRDNAEVIVYLLERGTLVLDHLGRAVAVHQAAAGTAVPVSVPVLQEQRCDHCKAPEVAAGDGLAEYVLLSSGDVVKPELELVHIRCGMRVCDAEGRDTLALLVRVAEVHRQECPVPPGTPVCRHGRAVLPGVREEAAQTCDTKQPWQGVGVFRGGERITRSECAVEAAWAAQRMNAEAKAPGGEPVFRWALVCLDHPEQPAQGCAFHGGTGDDLDACTCVEFCDEDPKTACGLSGTPHVHPEIPGHPGVYGPCPVHPGRPGDR